MTKIASSTKIILLVTIVGCIASTLCGLFVWNLTETEIF